MDAMFHGKKDNIPNWDELYTQYIDTSGMGQSRQLAILTGIYQLQWRLKRIDTLIEVQDKCFQSAGVPLQSYTIDGEQRNPLTDLNQFGYRITWNPANPDAFMPQLRRINVKERRNIAELDKLEKELADIERTGKVKESEATRGDFIRMLNMLRKDGYPIDKDKTDMEELCHMIAAHTEEVNALREQEAALKR